jgi:1-acyl-sn-glycerol-3-phosphate acyltransferase
VTARRSIGRIEDAIRVNTPNYDYYYLCPELRRKRMIPVDRKAAQGVVEQAAALIHGSDRFWYGLAPEGTRKRVERWKTGFWKIAKAADVPVLRMYFHYPDRIIGFGPLFHLSDDMAADMAAIREWYRPWMGKNRGTA